MDKVDYYEKDGKGLQTLVANFKDDVIIAS